MRKKLSCFVVFLFFAGLNLPAQNPYIHQYTTNNGLPSNNVYQVYTDSRKFIWFATDAGVARFDGAKYTYFRKQDGLSCNDVVRIKEDSYGRIWFFNMNATLNFYYEGCIYNGTNAPYLDSLKSKEFFHDFYEDEDKTLYFYYNYQREIFTLDSQNNIRKYKFPSKLLYNGIEPFEGMVIRYMMRMPDKSFYLCTIAGLYKLNDLDEQPMLISGDLNFKAVFPAQDGCIYIALGKSNPDEWEIRKFSNSDMSAVDSTVYYSQSIFLSSVLEDNSGNLWISTFDKGIYCYKGSRLINHFDIDEAQALAQDHEGNIWISSLKDGVFKISPYINQHTHYDCSNFQNIGITALCKNINGGIWCSNGKTLYWLKENDLYSSDFQNKGNSINQILQLNSQTLLVGQTGTFYNSLQGIHIHAASKKISFSVNHTSAKALKKMIYNPFKKQVFCFSTFNLSFINPTELFGNVREVWLDERIYNIFYNNHQDLIVNAKQNYVYKDDCLKVDKELACFDGKIITDYLSLNDSIELFNIEGDSLFILQNGKMLNLNKLFSNPIESQIQFIDYHEPTLFIATSRDIFLCEPLPDLLANKSVVLVPVDINFRQIEGVIFIDSILYIASDDGLTKIPYDAIRNIKMYSPIPYFRSVHINDKEDVTLLKNIRLTGRNRIHIDFGSINYSSNTVSYSYKLEGIDENWTNGNGTNVIYQGLPKGDYVFKLRVRKPTSDWSDPVEFGITIKATFWQHPLFYLILVLFLSGLTLLSILLKKNIQMKRQEVEHQLILLEQKALQSMMNPHFIFNSLGSIQNYLLQSRPSEAGLYLSQFARLIRQNLNSLNSALILLDEEVDRLKNYLDLEKLRMEQRFDYRIEIDDSVESDAVQIPSMIVQPFVENSIWHGIANLEEKGFIYIKFSIFDERSLQIMIEDNGIGIRNAEKYSIKGEKHLNLGMQMTRKRLCLLGKKYNMDASISIHDVSPASINPGTCVILVVPFILS